MNSIRVISILLTGFLYLVFQVLVLKNLVLFGSAFCFLYVTYIILLPIDLKHLNLHSQFR